MPEQFAVSFKLRYTIVSVASVYPVSFLLPKFWSVDYNRADTKLLADLYKKEVVYIVHRSKPLFSIFFVLTIQDEAEVECIHLHYDHNSTSYNTSLDLLEIQPATPPNNYSVKHPHIDVSQPAHACINYYTLVGPGHLSNPLKNAANITLYIDQTT